MEAVWKGPGDGLAVEGGPGVLKVRRFVEKALRTSLTLFYRLSLDENQLTSLPDRIGLLSNLTEYGIRFVT